MADVIARLKLESGEFDSKIKRAVTGLMQMEAECRKVGGTLAVLDKDQLDYVKSLGQMETVSNTAKGRLNELTQAYTELSIQYKRLTDEEKKGDFGKALSGSLEQLKGRIGEAKQQLKDVDAELGNASVSGNEFNNILSSLGHELGINSNLMGLVTTGAIGYTAVIGAAVTATISATKAWADYNNELSKQAQITSVTTGLTGSEATRMTDFANSIAKVYNVDFREVINAANTLMAQFGQSGDEAMQIIRDGMQGMIEGDGGKLLSLIQQYAPAFQSAGVSASQLVAVIQNSEGGIFSEQNMSAIIMALPKIKMMSENTAKALAGIGIDGRRMAADVESGAITVFDALQTISQAIDENKDKTKETSIVMQDLFGRQARTAGDNLGKAIATLNTNLEETKKQTGSVGQSLANLELANERLNESLRKTFGYDGWQQMANGVSTVFVGALAEAVDTAESLRETIHDVSGIDVFSVMISSATQALGPLGQVLDRLRQIAGIGKLGGGGITGTPGVGVAGLISGKSGGTSAATEPSATEKSLQAEIDRLNKLLSAKTTTGGSKTSQTWAPIDMASIAMPGISFGRSISDIEKDISKYQKRYKESDDIGESLAAKSMMERYQRELEARKAMENPFADAYKHNFGKDIERLNKDQEKYAKKQEVTYSEQLKGIDQMVGGISAMVGSLQNIGVDIPEGFNKMLGGMQAILTVLEAIQTIDTVGSILGIFSNGGVVHAAEGWSGVVPGSRFSGDQVPALLNSQELVLNTAQTGRLASALHGAQSGNGGTPYVDGEKIYLGVNNYLRRSGKGEIVTAR